MKVLLPIDDSKYARAAIESVINRPWWADTEFFVLSVLPTLAPAFAECHQTSLPAVCEAEREMRKVGQKLVDDTVEELRKALPYCQTEGAAIEGALVEGIVKDEIVRKAVDWQADFIIMGSHGRTGLTRFLMGSVSESVLHSAPCSVEIIRAKCDSSGPDRKSKKTRGEKSTVSTV